MFQSFQASTASPDSTTDDSSSEEGEGEEEEEEEEGEEEEEEEGIPHTAQEVLHAAGVDLDLTAVQPKEGAPLELVSQVRGEWLLSILQSCCKTSSLVLFLSQFLTCVMDEEFGAAKLLCEKGKCGQ